MLNTGRLIIPIVATMLLVACNKSNQPVDPDQERLTIVMGGDANYYPYTYLNDANQPDGLDVSILRAIAREIDVNLEIQLGSWSESLTKLEIGEIDIVPMFKTVFRQRKVIYAVPHKHRHYVLYGVKSSDYIYAADNLTGQDVYVQKDTAGETWLQETINYSNTVAFDDIYEVYKKFNNKEDAYILNEAVQFRSFLKKNDLELLTIKSPPLVSYDYAFASNTGKAELIKLIDIGMAAITESGEFTAIIDDYEKDLNPRSFFFYILIYVVLLTVVCSLTFFVCKYRKGLKQIGKTLSDEAKKRIEAEKKAVFLKDYDEFTGLINRKRLKTELKKLIDSNTDKFIGFIQLNIVDYIDVYISLGESVTNDLEKNLARNIQQNDVHIVGSISPGKLGIIIGPNETEDSVLEKTKHLFQELNSSISVNNLRIDIRCSMAIVVYPDHADDVETLIRHSYLAHLHATGSKNHYCVYDKSLEPDPKKLTLLMDFKQSMVDDEFILHYQPKLFLKENNISGAEILIRWKHHDFGLLPPFAFIPLLESTGLIKDLTLHIMAKAMEKQCFFSKYGILLSINVSTKDLTDQHFVETAIKLKEHFGSTILIEITETAFTNDYQLFINNVLILKEHGFQFSIDDYGTGYSSMQYLRDIKPYEIKVDQSFIKNIKSSYEDEILLSTTVKMSIQLKSLVTAEGVEDMDIADKVKEIGCDYAQGYGIAKPMPEKDFINWLTKSSSNT